MFPNEKFLRFFPRELLPAEKDERIRSGCFHIGAFLVIRKIISDYKLDEMIARIVGQDAGLFLDLAAYSIITEENAGQYYPDYAYNHALFTDDMKIYSDSKVSGFLRDVTVDQRIQFLNEWNAKRDHRERIYISYDSTNKSLVSGLVLEAQGSFENDRRNSIRAFKVSGTTIKRKLYASDKKERYFHIYYDDGRKASEREKLAAKRKQLDDRKVLDAYQAGDKTADEIIGFIQSGVPRADE